MKIIPAKPLFPEEDIRDITTEISDVLRNGRLTMGNKCKEFEDKFGKYTGTKYAVSTNSGAAALEMIIRALGIQGSEILMPTNTSADTALAITHSNNIPLFLDIDETACLNPNQINKSVTAKTKALIIVHLGGIMHHKIEEIVDICKKNNIYLIEDAAHAHGSAYKNIKAGNWGVAAAFSFYPTKVITSCEGGMITTNSKELYGKAMQLRDRGKPEFNSNISICMGSSWRMSEVHAIIGLHQLKRLNSFIKKRREIATKYDNILTKLKWIKPLKIHKEVLCNYYKYIALTEKDVKKSLRKDNIFLSGEVYKIPCHRHEIFKKFANSKYPVADKFCSSHLCLPIFNGMEDDEVDYVIKALEKI